MIRGVGGVVHDAAGRLLVVRRAHAPLAGAWSIPGGKVEPGESDVAAVRRELLEETGLVVRAVALLGVVRLGDYEVHDYRCAWLSGELAAGSDAAAAAWVSLAELMSLETTPQLVPLLRSWGALPL